MEMPRIVDIRQSVVPIRSPIRNAYIDFSAMTASVVAIVTNISRSGKPVVGYGFNSNGRYAPVGLLAERFIPRLLEADPASIVDADGRNFDPFRAWDAMMTGEKPGGHGERSVAVGVLDMALWDAVAKIDERPLYHLLADRFNDDTISDSVWVYAAGGYYAPGKSIADLKEEMGGFLNRGYDTVKIKIGGTDIEDDLRRIEAVIDVVGKGGRLAVDANGRFDLEMASAYADRLKPYGLRWYEEPGDPLDFELQARLGALYDHPLATGENLFSMQDARNLLRYGGMRRDRDILQFDPALSYGLVEYLRILDVLDDHGWSRAQCIPHGGHQFALNIAAGLGLGGNESYPDVFQPFGGFADEVAVIDGRVGLPEIPGVGFEAKANLWEVMEPLGA